MPSGLPDGYYSGFSGCVRRVKVFRKRLDLLRGGGDAGGIEFCRGDGDKGLEVWDP